MPSAAWFSQAIAAEEGDNEEEEEEEEEEAREGRRAHPRLRCAWLPALFLSLMSVSQRNTRLANGKATGESSALARSGKRGRDGRERRRHLYLSLVKFRRRREQKTGGRGREGANDGRRNNSRRPPPSRSLPSRQNVPLSPSSRSWNPAKKLCPLELKVLNWPNRKSVVGKQGGLCVAASARGGQRVRDYEQKIGTPGSDRNFCLVESQIFPEILCWTDLCPKTDEY